MGDHHAVNRRRMANWEANIPASLTLFRTLQLGVVIFDREPTNLLFLVWLLVFLTQASLSRRKLPKSYVF
jgi:hypothetical protein